VGQMAVELPPREPRLLVVLPLPLVGVRGWGRVRAASPHPAGG
jgi:hypothetical protein